MNATRYFTEQVLRKRTYLTLDLCMSVLTTPLRREEQEDGETLHNAVLDRGYKRDGP